MLNEFESCSSRLFRSKSTHSPCSTCCRKRVGWIRCKCNQNLERNESDRSFAKDDDAYDLHGTGAGVCSNELQCVAFASSRNFKRGSTSREGTQWIIFLFFYENLYLCVPSVRADFG